MKSYPLTGADLRLLIIAEGTVHDPDHAPTHHVCCTSLMENTWSICGLKKKNLHFIFFHVVLSQVTTERQEKSQHQILR